MRSLITMSVLGLLAVAFMTTSTGATTPASSPSRTASDGGEKTVEVSATGGFTITKVEVNGTALESSDYSVDGDGSSSPTITLLDGLARGDAVVVTGEGANSNPDPDIKIKK